MKNNASMIATASLLLVLILQTSCHALEGPADVQVLRESRPVAGAKELVVDLKYDVGKLEIMRAAEDLFTFDLQYDRNRYDPTFNFDSGDRSALRLDLSSRGGLRSSGGRDNDLTLRLTDKVPLDLNLNSGVSESRLEMTGIKVRRMQLRGGVGKTEVMFDKPSGQVLNSLEVESGVGELIIHGLGNAQVEQLDFKGGVGHAELDFTGDLGAVVTEARIKVGVGAVRVTVPRDADVEVEAEGSFLSNISAPSFEKNGRNYTHRGDGGAKIRIQVESGIGAVEIELI
jgi:hypothetical protein